MSGKEKYTTVTRAVAERGCREASWTTRIRVLDQPRGSPKSPKKIMALPCKPHVMLPASFRFVHGASSSSMMSVSMFKAAPRVYQGKDSNAHGALASGSLPAVAQVAGYQGHTKTHSSVSPQVRGVLVLTWSSPPTHHNGQGGGGGERERERVLCLLDSLALWGQLDSSPSRSVAKRRRLSELCRAGVFSLLLVGVA